MRIHFLLPLLALAVLASCQQTPATTETPATATEAPAQTPTEQPATGATTEAAARAAVAQFIQQQPNANLFVVDSARVNDNDASWQVLVPRTDWASRMPNRARFEVDKATGTVHTAAVK